MSASVDLSETPLVEKYFGRYLNRLISAQYEGRFYLAVSFPTMLEERLKRIEPAGQTQAVVSEIGEISDPIELDRRLMDVWAELRVIDLLLMEGFAQIKKVREPADLTAYCKELLFAFQVKRINSALASEVIRRNPPEKRNMQPYGTLDDIHARFDGPVSYYFWDALLEKNGQFHSFTGAVRCIVIVSGDEDLQDPMLRQIACKQIRDGLYDPALGQRNFETILWLPDTSPGAWFFVGDSPHESRCYADWKDEPGSDGWEETGQISRREVNLDSPIYNWLFPYLIHRMCS